MLSHALHATLRCDVPQDKVSMVRDLDGYPWELLELHGARAVSEGGVRGRQQGQQGWSADAWDVYLPGCLPGCSEASPGTGAASWVEGGCGWAPKLRQGTGKTHVLPEIVRLGREEGGVAGSAGALCEQAGPPVPQAERLCTVALRVRDLAASLRWYQVTVDPSGH